MITDILLNETEVCKAKNDINIVGCPSNDCMNKKFYLNESWKDMFTGDKITVNSIQYIILGKGIDNNGCFINVRPVFQDLSTRW
jgi:hypothetical protein